VQRVVVSDDLIVEARLNKRIQKADWEFPSLNHQENLHGSEFLGQRNLG
jgi:hypothetical protein